MIEFSGEALDATHIGGLEIYKYRAKGWGWNDNMIEKILTKEENPEYWL